MSQPEYSTRTSCQVDLGQAGRTEVEVDFDRLWSSIGRQTKQVDLWMKQVAGGVDLRVHIERTEGGLVLVVDRGDNPGTWSHGVDAPVLCIHINDRLVAEVTASMGASQQHHLGLADLQGLR